MYVCVRHFILVPQAVLKFLSLDLSSICKQLPCSLIQSVKLMLANQTVDSYAMIKEALPCYLCLIAVFLGNTVKSPQNGSG